ncbi:MAG: ATP-dependent 6-phosphofructokinase [Clostridiales Family XIII bacterium]|nr:ATP-dependent 6-phosphofructokinase [Clostridiales Family XIII bacterium]
MKVALLTSGGDCQGLNPTLRGVAKALYYLVPDVEIYGVENGYKGLIENRIRPMSPSDFSGIVRLGGTILGTSRQPFKTMTTEDGLLSEKAKRIIENYRTNGFDALVVLGGNGTQKTANLLYENGVNVTFLPKTIDNDISGTDLTFGFDSAVAKATDVIDAVHSTAESHGRVFVVELMGHDVGWIALYSGVAGGADIILIPEIPYDTERVLDAVRERNKIGKGFTIIAIAEGAMTKEEHSMKKKERAALTDTAGGRLANSLQEVLRHEDKEVRLVVPGYFLRGGDPTATDRVLCTRLGVKAAELVAERRFGFMVAEVGQDIVVVRLAEVTGVLKRIGANSQFVREAKRIGIVFGD